MTDFRKLAFVGLMGLGMASLACSSSGGTAATGGTSGGTGGSHTGGSTGTGGSGGTSAGTGGTTVGCGMSDAPASAEIATFATADGGTAAMFGTFSYPGTTPMPTFTVTGGAVNVMDTVPVAGGPHYHGFGVYMNGNAAGTDCVDAHTYTGVQFDLSGSLTGTGCTMQFSILDSEHADMTASTDPKAGAPAGSYAPQLQITSAQLTSAGTTVVVPFTGPAGGSPASALDPTKLTGVQWQLSTPTPADGGATECVWNINLKNVKFY